VDDAARARAFDTLQTRVGVEPDAILSAPKEALESVRGLPLAAARRALMKFPSIGEPGAEKVLLFGRAYPVLGLDSNGVRVLTRLGLVSEARGYSATYRGVKRLAADHADRGIEWLLRAHLL
ncbi:MAG TPA: hypothetical protein VGK33_20875, partial [Chloroflexota bacterium]